ncbi:MAG TPA: 4Fe-4S binding protein, partial [Acholeplasmataceae bacterium]|nr:4Fe-4S binding protein [Acholeplasmataceae bacterium]
AGVILASFDAVSLDRVAASVCNLDPEKIFVTKIATERKYGEGNLEKIEILGESLDSFRDLKFQEPVNPHSTFGLRLLKYSFLRNLLLEHPRIDHVRCIKCGECAKICPPQALRHRKGNFPNLRKTDCIRCWCCAEVCPKNAIKKTKRPLVGRIALKNRD